MRSVHDFVLRGFDHRFGRPGTAVQDDPEWRRVRDAGSHLWLDTGDIDEAGRLWNSSFEALTTNNTLLNKEIQKGLSDTLIVEAAREFHGIDVIEIAFILNAHHALRLVGRGKPGSSHASGHLPRPVAAPGPCRGARHQTCNKPVAIRARLV